MGLVDQLLGRRSVTEDSVAPVMTAKPKTPLATRTNPKDKEDEKRKLRSVVASIMGLGESDDEAIIPDDAKQIDSFDGASLIPGVKDNVEPKDEGPSSPQATLAVGKEELIQPFAALVAPDITPNVMKMIDPSQVPAPPKPVTPPQAYATGQAPQRYPGGVGAMDVLLGRDNPEMTPEAAAMAESLAASMTSDHVDIASRVQEAITPAAPGESTMPIHKEGDGKTIFNTFRKFM